MCTFSEWTKPGMVAVDIGANVGTFTGLLLQLVGASGIVVVLEPQSQLTEILTERFPEARVIQAAVTDTDGATVIYHSLRTPQASLYEANVLEPIGQAEHVRSVTLDGLQRSGEIPARVDVIKVDAQGSEAAILRGATQLLETQRPVLYLELWRQGLEAAGSSVEAIRAQLEPLGYQPSRHTWDATVQQANEQRGHSAIDVLLVPQKGTV